MAIEKVLIIAVKTNKITASHFQATLDELSSLTHTAGGTLLEILSQNREKIHPVTYVGEGKADEAKEMVDSLNIDLVIANDELSPSQLRNLNDLFGVRTIDRSQLILDIFAKRANTKEGKLQVELAQLEYMLPRLRGMGIVLSRLGGGIGTRGPGETKLEIDQRHIRNRIDEIKRRLKEIVKQRSQYRKRRKETHQFQIAIIGYTNAGKSTLFNRLTNEESLEENLLFATLDPLSRKLHLPSGFECLLIDTVGFLQELPTSLIAAFKSTLEEVTEADLLLHVIDVSNPDYQQQTETVFQVLKELEADQIPQLAVYNKKDLLTEDFFADQHPNMLISALDQGDLDALLVKIEKLLKAEWEFFATTVRADQGNLMYQLQKHAILTKQDYREQMNDYKIEGYIRENHPLQGEIKGE